MKVGILGGTFDPVHSGHIYVGRQILGMLSLDRILFMVARTPPHKTGVLTSSYHRYAMVTLATRGEEGLFPCAWELTRPSPSFTIDLLDGFRISFPSWKVCFIAGSDLLPDLHLWKECDRLLNENSFVFVQRPGETVDLEKLKLPDGLKERILPAGADDCPQVSPGVSSLITLGAPHVSSSALRQVLAAGRVPSKETIPPAVIDYARKFRLYERHKTDS